MQQTAPSSMQPQPEGTALGAQQPRTPWSSPCRGGRAAAPVVSGCPAACRTCWCLQPFPICYCAHLIYLQEEIPGINTALSELYSRLAPWIPCQLLLVLHFRYSNSSVKTSPGGKLLGPWAELGGSAWSQPVGRPWCESTGISWCSAVGGAGTARRLQHCIPMSQPWQSSERPATTAPSLQAELHLPVGANHILLAAGPGPLSNTELHSVTLPVSTRAEAHPSRAKGHWVALSFMAAGWPRPGPCES